MMNLLMSSTRTWFTMPNKMKMKARMKLESSLAMEKTVTSDGGELSILCKHKILIEKLLSSLDFFKGDL